MIDGFRITHGTLTLNANGSFLYTPNPLYHGADFFTYRVSDGGLWSDPATVNLTVLHTNHLPVANNDVYDTFESQPLVVASPGVLGNDTDVDPSTVLNALLVTAPNHGTVTLLASGRFTYVAGNGYVGTDQFTYRASDFQGFSQIATVTINVGGANHRPVAVDDAYTVDQDQTLRVAAPGVLANDSDADPQPTLSAVVTTGPQHGTLTLDSTGGFVYTPTAGYRGSDSFTYYASDGSSPSDPATVTLTVSPVNHSPSALAHSYTAIEDTPLAVFAAQGLLGNASDVDPGTTLTASVVLAPAHGALAINPDGSFLYIPSANFHGVDSFSYAVSDGQASVVAGVTMTVNAVNDAPVLTGTASAATQGRVTPGGFVLATFTDSDLPPASAYSTIIAWGDGSFSTGTVSQAGGVYSVHGDHVYDSSGSFAARVTLTDTEPGGVVVGTFANVTVAPIGVALSGSVLTAGTGAADGSLITNTPAITIVGTAPSGFLVTAFTTNTVSGAVLPVGQAVAGEGNVFTIVTNTLGDGSYDLTLRAVTNVPGSSLAFDGKAGRVLIDTTGPRIVGTTVNRSRGTATITLRDEGSGLDSSQVVSGSLFRVTIAARRRTQKLAVTETSPLAFSPGALPSTITLTMNRGRKLPRGTVNVGVVDGAIKDLAGNSLITASIARVRSVGPRMNARLPGWFSASRPVNHH